MEGGKELEGGWVQRGEEELIGGFSLLAGGIRQPVQGLAIHHPPTASGSEIQHPPPLPPPPPPPRSSGLPSNSTITHGKESMDR